MVNLYTKTTQPDKTLIPLMPKKSDKQKYYKIPINS